MSLIETSVEIILTVIVVYVLFGIYIPYIYNDMRTPDITRQTAKVRTMIIDGRLPLSGNEIQFDTQNKDKYPYYKELVLSSNINGGAQYTLSMWLNKQSLNLSENNKQFDLFLIGNKNSMVLDRFQEIDKTNGNTLNSAYSSVSPGPVIGLAKTATKQFYIFDDKVYEKTSGDGEHLNPIHTVSTVSDTQTSDGSKISKPVYEYVAYQNWKSLDKNKETTPTVAKPMIVQKAPYIYFRYFTVEEIKFETMNYDTKEPDYKNAGVYLVVEFNSLKRFHNRIFLPQEGRILEKLNLNTWTMISFVFTSYKNMVNFDAGCKITMYMNDTEMMSKTIKDDSIRVNNGMIYVLPKYNAKNSSGVTPDYTMDSSQNQTKNNGSIADVSYFNHSLTSTEIQSLYRKGFSDKTFSSPRELANSKIVKKYMDLSLDDRLDRDYAYA
jgi:hypothetical protein